jgi:2-polyprenyl-3-methyl-5-hydroxy-6-metoxy-1,4-benzoquinol methylase
MKNKKKSTRAIHLIRKKMWDASVQKFALLIDKKTNLINKKFTETRNCPTCNNKNNKFLLIKNGGTYVECKKCSMIFINPVLKDKNLEEHYRNNHDVRSKISVTKTDFNFFKFTYSKGLDLINKYFDKPGSILDVGCSAGMFLDMAKKNKWKTFGLELNSKEAKLAIHNGHNVQQKILKYSNFDIKFDVITFWDSFEHIKNGLECLNNCKKILKKGGIVFLQCPSRDALALKVMQERCNMLDGVEHVNIYGHKSLIKLCKKTKSKILDYETIISEIGVVNNYLNFDDPYLGYTKNTKKIFEIIDDKQLHKNKLGYKFQACIKFN